MYLSSLAVWTTSLMRWLRWQDFHFEETSNIILTALHYIGIGLYLVIMLIPSLAIWLTGALLITTASCIPRRWLGEL